MISLNLCQSCIIFCTPYLTATKQIARPSASKTGLYMDIYTDSNTVTYNITKNSKGVGGWGVPILLCSATNLVCFVCNPQSFSALLFAQPKGAGEETAAGADRQHRGTGLCAGHSAASAC